MQTERTPSRTFLVEHYWPGSTVAEFKAAADSVRAAAETMALGAAPIRFLHSTLVPEDENAFCVFSAASATLVEEAYRRAGVRFEGVREALELEPPPARRAQRKRARS